MNIYKITYRCRNGYVGTEIIMAANRIAALEVFKDFGYEDVVSADCVLVPYNESEDDE